MVTYMVTYVVTYTATCMVSCSDIVIRALSCLTIFVLIISKKEKSQSETTYTRIFDLNFLTSHLFCIEVI